MSPPKTARSRKLKNTEIIFVQLRLPYQESARVTKKAEATPSIIAHTDGDELRGGKDLGLQDLCRGVPLFVPAFLLAVGANRFGM